MDTSGGGGGAGGGGQHVRRASAGSSSNHSSLTPEEAANASITRPRARGREHYGGGVSFGGLGGHQLVSPTSGALSSHGGAAASSYLRRSNRLLAASPYFSQDRMAKRLSRRQRAAAATTYNEQDEDDLQQSEAVVIAPADTSRSPSGLSGGAASSSRLSSTARTILDTLERMSTPVRDAQRIPVPGPARAERRRQIAEELLGEAAVASASASLLMPGGGGSARRRPRLGGDASSTGSLPSTPAKSSSSFLSGPPLRSSLFAPLPQGSSPYNSKRSLQASDAASSFSSSAPKLTRLEQRPPPSATSTSSSNVNSTTSLAKPPANPSFPTGFFANAFASSTPSVQTGERIGAVSNMRSATAAQQPLTENKSGKVRAKVSERAKLREERKADTGDQDTIQIPDYLSKAAAGGNNHFAGMTTLPSFQFSSPDRMSSTAKSGSNGIMGSLGSPSTSSRKLEESQRLLTSPELNPADSPISSSAGSRHAARRAGGAAPPPPFFADPVSVVSGVLGAGKAAQAAGAAAPPLTNGLNGQDEREETKSKGKEQKEFPFSVPEKPIKLKRKALQLASSGDLVEKCEQQFNLAAPQPIHKKAKQGVGPIL